jgi:hypothetical protein
MSTNILIEKEDDSLRKKSSFDKSSVYSLVDKAYYVDALCYKIDH